MFVNQHDLGKHFNLSPKKVGDLLDAIGLRNGSNNPTPEAFAGGYVAKSNHPNGWYYVWHLQKTVAALEAAGHKRVPQPSTAKPTGPFSTVRRKGDEWLVLNSDGTYSVVVLGEDNAKRLVAVFNLADKHGLLNASK